MGALVEGPGFYPYLSGRDNLRVLARYRGTGDDDVERALERAGLAARAGDPFKAYSLGMQQRLGVAAALLGDPGLLILDEPTNGLDPAGVGDMRLLLAELAAPPRSPARWWRRRSTSTRSARSSAPSKRSSSR